MYTLALWVLAPWESASRMFYWIDRDSHMPTARLAHLGNKVSLGHTILNW
jgi:hypothetical protein